MLHPILPVKIILQSRVGEFLARIEYSRATMYGDYGPSSCLDFVIKLPGHRLEPQAAFQIDQLVVRELAATNLLAAAKLGLGGDINIACARTIIQNAISAITQVFAAWPALFDCSCPC
jgi:hypothetical protein